MSTRKAHMRRQGNQSHPSAQASMQINNVYPQPQQPYPFQPSDYESDNAYLSTADQTLPTVIPPSPSRSTDEVNLTVLQRYNPAVAAIISIASYAVVYVFSPAASTWEKIGVEGTLFICQLYPGLHGEDRYTVIVLNRRGLDNFEAQLFDEGDVEITDEYVILNVKDEGPAADSEPKVYGLWIFCEPPPSSTAESRTINAKLMKECAAQAGQSRQEAQSSGPLQPQHPHGSTDDHGALLGRQIGLQHLFSQQVVGGSRQAQAGPHAIAVQGDVLGNLFRRAGLGSP